MLASDHLMDGHEGALEAPPQPQVVGVTEGSQMRFYGLNLQELVKINVWTRAFEATWYKSPNARFTCLSGACRAPGAQGTNCISSRGKENCKIKTSKWSIKCLQNMLLCHPVNCTSIKLFHAYI